jgi:hypothetical protein
MDDFLRLVFGQSLDEEASFSSGIEEVTPETVAIAEPFESHM